MNLAGRLLNRYSLQEYAGQVFSYGGLQYLLGSGGYTPNRSDEPMPNSFEQYVRSIYFSSGPVFAVAAFRMRVFSEARFQWQQLRNGSPGDLFGNSDLEILERPWPNGTTGELLARTEQDATLAGNFFAVRELKRVRRLRPDWTEIVLTAPPSVAVKSDVAGYKYTPGGPGSPAKPVYYLPDEVAHWSPIPDPLAQYRGMSWLTPVVREVVADDAALRHKLAFFDHAATPQLAVSVNEEMSSEDFKEFMEITEAAHAGVDNAWKTLYLGGGADVTVVGKDLKELDFVATQGHSETRIAAAAGISPVLLPFSEGMQGSSLNAGNFTAARRNTAATTFRPNWRSVCACFEVLLTRPGGARLWYDDRNIDFLREDRKDVSAIQFEQAQAIRQLVDAGYEPASVVKAVMAEDYSMLVHTNLYSVQLQPPGAGQPPAPPPPPAARESAQPEIHVDARTISSA